MAREWLDPDHALAYLARIDRPHRAEGEAVLLEFVHTTVERILDLGPRAVCRRPARLGA